MPENFKDVPVEQVEPVGGTDPDKPAGIFEDASCTAVTQSLKRGVVRKPEIFGLRVQYHHPKAKEEAESSF